MISPVRAVGPLVGPARRPQGRFPTPQPQQAVQRAGGGRPGGTGDCGHHPLGPHDRPVGRTGVPRSHDGGPDRQHGTECQPKERKMRDELPRFGRIDRHEGRPSQIMSPRIIGIELEVLLDQFGNLLLNEALLLRFRG